MSLTVVGSGNPSAPTFPVQRSVRLRASASAYFNRTPASAGNRKTWTWSAWVKRGQLNPASYNALFSSATNGSNTDLAALRFSTDSLQFFAANGTNAAITTAVFRDPSAWYHIVAVLNTTGVANGFTLYVNGVQQTLTYTSFTADLQPSINNTVPHNVGAQLDSGSGRLFYFDGYLTEVNFIDGQALTPASFGSINSSTGVWQPIKYSGTYGTNGFYLNFQDNSGATATTIGKDSSGNGNNWTPNNISVTAGVTYDSMLDVPTLTSATNSNFWTFNPLIPVAGATYSNGNLQYTNSGNNKSGFASPLPTTGKWYWEGTWITSGSGSNPIIGLAQAGFENTQGASGELGYRSSGNKFDQAATETAYGSSWTTGDVIGVAVDMDAGTIVFYKNGTSQGTAFTTVLTALTQPVSPMFRVNVAGDVFAFNFGQRPFTYTPPTGFKSLNTYNLPTPTIPNGALYMAATLYTGTGAALSVANTVNGVSFQPDFVWIKSRSAASNHAVLDSVRPSGFALYPNLTAVEGDNSTLFTGITSTGFGVAGTNVTYNQAAATYVGWQWKANGTPAVTNTNGAIPSTVSANTTSGFSVVTYTNAATSGTVGHGLGVAPSMIIMKGRGPTAANWTVFHSSLANMTTAYLNLNSTSAAGTLGSAVSAPTSTTFGTNSAAIPASENSVAYCFAQIAGFSKFGSYTGNGSTDGPFVYLGFRPRYILIKRTDTIFEWFVQDTARSTTNVSDTTLQPNSSNSEATIGTGYNIDFLSNGFKCRAAGSASNASGGTYIYACFAENPFNYSLAR